MRRRRYSVFSFSLSVKNLLYTNGAISYSSPLRPMELLPICSKKRRKHTNYSLSPASQDKGLSPPFVSNSDCAIISPQQNSVDLVGEIVVSAVTSSDVTTSGASSHSCYASQISQMFPSCLIYQNSGLTKEVVRTDNLKSLSLTAPLSDLLFFLALPLTVSPAAKFLICLNSVEVAILSVHILIFQPIKSSK